MANMKVIIAVIVVIIIIVGFVMWTISVSAPPEPETVTVAVPVYKHNQINGVPINTSDSQWAVVTGVDISSGANEVTGKPYLNIQNVEQAKARCDARPACIGFPYRSTSRSIWPKKAINFDNNAQNPLRSDTTSYIKMSYLM